MRIRIINTTEQREEARKVITNANRMLTTWTPIDDLETKRMILHIPSYVGENKITKTVQDAISKLLNEYKN